MILETSGQKHTALSFTFDIFSEYFRTDCPAAATRASCGNLKSEEFKTSNHERVKEIKLGLC